MKKIKQYLLVKSIGLYINLLSYLAPQKAFDLAYQLFSQPRKGKLKPDQLPKTLIKTAQEIHSYKEHHIHTYLWKGNEDIILLVHGWESNASRWKKLLPYLIKSGKTIVALDGPAHGLSSGKEFNVPVYAEFIDHIVQKYQPRIVIGHSIGGNALSYFQAHYPHQFDKMILLGAPSDFEIILNNYFKMLSLNHKVQEAIRQYIKKRFDIHIPDFSGAKFLTETSIPGIIAHDIDDTVVLLEEGKKMANSWKTAQFIETQGLGHSMHDAELYTTIIDFIQK